jgi:hypothetical protein
VVAQVEPVLFAVVIWEQVLAVAEGMVAAPVFVFVVFDRGDDGRAVID